MLAVKQNKKRGREETNDTESFKSMFFWGLRIMKSFKDSFELSNGRNAKQNHLSLLSKPWVYFQKDFRQQPSLSRSLRSYRCYLLHSHASCIHIYCDSHSSQ
jgi:hypothetical protein